MVMLWFGPLMGWKIEEKVLRGLLPGVSVSAEGLPCRYGLTNRTASYWWKKKFLIVEVGAAGHHQGHGRERITKKVNWL